MEHHSKIKQRWTVLFVVKTEAQNSLSWSIFIKETNRTLRVGALIIQILTKHLHFFFILNAWWAILWWFTMLLEPKFLVKKRREKALHNRWVHFVSDRLHQVHSRCTERVSHQWLMKAGFLFGMPLYHCVVIVPDNTATALHANAGFKRLRSHVHSTFLISIALPSTSPPSLPPSDW